VTAGMSELVVYQTRWCGDCRMARRVFEQHGVEYTGIDIDHDPEARHRVQEINGGYKSVPTIVFPSGRVVVEPSAPQLIEALRDEGLLKSA
jgi:mycoredoxin